MDKNTLAIQTALKAAGYDPGILDGVFGTKTKDANEAWIAAGGRPLAPLVPNDVPSASPFKGIVMHWTAGGPNASSIDLEHYHFVVQQDGKVIAGKFKPEANLNPVSGAYAAHTLNANTGRIGVSMCGMAGAQERPFSAGVGLTDPQVDAFCELVADLCRRYGIPVTRTTVLSHAEVQPTLGIVQRGKWDIAWLPGMTAPGDPVAVGDTLRANIISFM